MKNIILIMSMVTCFGLEKNLKILKLQKQKTFRFIEQEPKKAALDVLINKCNVCHRKKNPFKVFSQKNMEKHAPKIYQQVFVMKRMPKGEKTKLTDEEYRILKNWLVTENIF